MAFIRCETASKHSREVATEQLCLADIALLYGTNEQAEILGAIQMELRNRQPASHPWCWEAVPQGRLPDPLRRSGLAVQATLQRAPSRASEDMRQ